MDNRPVSSPGYTSQHRATSSYSSSNRINSSPSHNPYSTGPITAPPVHSVAPSTVTPIATTPQKLSPYPSTAAPTSPTRVYAPSLRSGHESVNNNDDSHNVTFQLIDENKHFNTSVLDYFRNISIEKCGLNYHIVSVFGSQSTGKSTLLNALFGTRFDVMNEIKRQQTTKGIWMASAQKPLKRILAPSDGSGSAVNSRSPQQPNLLIMDVEGTDGRERGEDQDFERKSALFALATSEVLIVNMWENQVGLYQGANMGLLKTVFEVNLSLFHTSAKTNRSLILFVIRDHIGATPLANLQNTILTDLKRIWESLSKPEAAANSSLDDFFDLEFYTLPHKILMADQFASQTATLSQHFTETTSSSYLFKPEYHRGVPLDGWPMYSEQIWEQIEQNKDLDLPTQQTLVARFRCEEIANQAWQHFESGLAEAQQTSNNAFGGSSVVENFGPIVRNIRGGSLELYDSLASRYSKSVYLHKREDLQAKVDTRLSSVYKAQLLALNKSAVTLFKSIIKSAQKQSNANSHVAFVDVLKHGYKKSVDQFIAGAKGSSIDDNVFLYDEQLALLKKELSSIEKAAKASEIKRISLLALKKIKSSFSNDLETYFFDPTDDTWDKILVFFNNTVLFALTSVTTRYKRENGSAAKPEDSVSSFGTNNGYDFGVGGTDAENEKGVGEIRRNAWLALDSELKQITRDENVLFRLREKFEDLFKYDSHGVPIVWKAGDDIETPYVSAREKSLKMLPIFATARLKDGTLVVPDVNSSSEDGLDGIANKKKGDEDEDEDEDEESDEASGLDADTFPHRISNSKEQDLTKRFKKQADATYIEAKRSTTQMAKQVPFYIIVLLVVLGWNEFMAVLRNPFLFLFLLLAGAGGYVTYTLNLWGPIVSVSNAMMDRTFEVGKQRLRELLEVPEGQKIQLRSSASSNVSRSSSRISQNRFKQEDGGDNDSISESIPLQDIKRRPTSSSQTSSF